MDDGLLQLLANVMLFGGILALAALVLLLVKRPFLRVLHRLLGEGPSWTISRTIRLSSGPRPDSLRWTSALATPDAFDLPRGDGPPAPLPSDSAEGYRDAWRRIEARFDDHPSQAVRDAHALVSDVARRRGEPGILTTDAQLTASSPAEAVEAFRSVFQQVRAAREATQAAQRALSFGSADRAALRKAMDQYARMLEQLLGGAPGRSLDDPPRED